MRFVALILWLVSGALGILALLQSYEATRLLATLLLPYDPINRVSSAYTVIIVARFMLILLGIAWLAAVVLLQDRYSKLAGDGRQLARYFGIVTAIELAVAGLALATLRLAPRLLL